MLNPYQICRDIFIAGLLLFVAISVCLLWCGVIGPATITSNQVTTDLLIAGKVKIGGEIYSDDYINDNYWNKMKNTSTTVQTSASLNFVDTFQVGGSFNAGNTVCLNQIFFKENNY